MKFIKKQFAKLRLKDQKLEKELATIDNTPWVKVINVSMKDPKDPSTGFFELDWNDAFVQSLHDAGYSGREGSEVVDQWFNDLCRGVISDEFAQENE
jgi:hypothetical protein|tara:strand:- start:2850 stop:3140 length:291 start_codon:yes stop_codon:yes gene_type:complete